ncbi:MAG TPA: hypothetical protein VGM32_04385 [Rhodopila sp.]
MEEIYIGRSVRESRIAPTEYCSQARTGFDSAIFEDRYSFRSTATRAADGRVVDANVQTIGSLHACFGPTANPANSSFYAEGALGGVSFTGNGECHMVRADFPERGLYPFRCFLDLTGLPADYAGGELTTNSIVSRNTLGPETDPPGYSQSSIATIRLWRKQPER